MISSRVTRRKIKQFRHALAYIQGGHLNMAVAFWYLVISYFSSAVAVTKHVTFHKVPEKHGNVEVVTL